MTRLERFGITKSRVNEDDDLTTIQLERHQWSNEGLSGTGTENGRFEFQENQWMVS